MLEYSKVILHSWNSQLKSLIFVNLGIKMDNCTLCGDTLSRTQKQDILSCFSWHTWASELRALPQYSSKKIGEFYPACQIAESSNRETQEIFFCLSFSFALLVNFSSRYWKWTEQKERWAWIQKKWGFDLKKKVKIRAQRVHISLGQGKWCHTHNEQQQYF